MSAKTDKKRRKSKPMLTGVGIDISEVGRFSFKKSHPFLIKNFSAQELEYCFSFADPKPHLAGTFACKEAVYKALDKKNMLLKHIQIMRDKNNRPTVRIKNRSERSVLVSMSHTRDIAIAMAIRT